MKIKNFTEKSSYIATFQYDEQETIEAFMHAMKLIALYTLADNKKRKKK